MFKMWFVHFLALAILAGATNAGCPSMCQCSDSLLSCSSQFLEGVPNFESLEVEPQTVDLSENSIFTIGATDFSFDGVENVQYLFLNNNHIVDIQENAFSEMKSVKEINLNTNSLDSVPPMLFADNPQLVSLDLSNNFFDLETPEIYSDSLEALDLSSTKISTFSESNIRYLPKLKILNLSYNRIKSIDTSIFSNVPYLLAVDLAGNFFNCDQKTIDLFDFLTDKGLTDVVEPVKCVTEDGFFQDIYTSAGPVDIFSISLETSDEPKQEADNSEKIEPVSNGEQTDEAVEAQQDGENLNENAAVDYVNEEAIEENVASDDTADANIDEVIEEDNVEEEVGVEESQDVDEKIDDDAEDGANENADEEDEETNEETLEENKESVDDNYLGEEEFGNVELAPLKTDEIDALLEQLEKEEQEATNDEEAEKGQINEKDTDSDGDVMDIIDDLLKEEASEDIDDYGEDYWETGDEYVEPEKPKEDKLEKTAEEQAAQEKEDEEAMQEALKIIEEEEQKEKAVEAEVSSEAPAEMGISVIREDQYFVVLERDSDESLYSVTLTSNITYLLGIMAFVLTFIAGIIFGFCAIRNSITKKRRREMHGSTNVLIEKWSNDLA